MGKETEKLLSSESRALIYHRIPPIGVTLKVNPGINQSYFRVGLRVIGEASYTDFQQDRTISVRECNVIVL